MKCESCGNDAGIGGGEHRIETHGHMDITHLCDDCWQNRQE
jgi:hypothetical protein